MSVLTGKKGNISWEKMMTIPAEELREHSRIDLKIYDEAAAIFDDLAEYMADFIEARNNKDQKTVIITPVGPKKHYPKLAEITNQRNISWKNVYCFAMDEWLDWQCRLLPEESSWSFRGYMKRNLYARIRPDLRPPDENLFFPTPENMTQYSGWLEDLGGADLCYGGFGYSGHIANNEPPFSRWWHLSLDDLRQSVTRILPLNEETLIAFSHRAAGGDTKMIPPMAVTIGMKDILASKKLLLISDGGAWKQHTLRVLLMHDPTEMYPCTLAQEHPDCEVWVDAKTAAPPSRVFEE